MAKIAILGFGTVGSGVQEVLQRNATGIARRLGEALEIKYIVDIRDFSSHPNASLFTSDYDKVLQDPEVKVVVETIGGLKPALDYVTRALQSGRHAVTSNKELVAQHGATLLATAKANNVCFLFEASVGGGTPIITPMHQCLAANTISLVAGIVNGTTNFMLTRMEQDGLDFNTALKEAQDLGYAETINPSSDVDGIDAGRKISILASLAFGSHVYPQNVPMCGIREITPADMQNAKTLSGAVKLIAWAKKSKGTPLACGVEPMIVPRTNQLFGVEDVFNAVIVNGDMLGDVVFYGRGAGKLPTASAVVADIIDSLKDGVKIHDSLFWLPAKPIDGLYESFIQHDYYIRAKNPQNAEKLQSIPCAKPIDGKSAVLVPLLTAKEFAATKESLKQQGCEVFGMKIWE